ncbi:sensor histidine kinase [Leptolyngbya iicbica]|uniref:histidine kinase n=2 Tax=Cyanophyceae TaxID=3028117 RepID=A0A4Q7E7U1_9CYAN|nr:ATP-binding protein [Leptolyngbya sp. LK]RZM78588.1 ATP-binding protein [Leptolyngbya sp. LK]
MDDLRIDSTLENLQLHHFGVKPATLGSVIFQALERDPVLPGVILLARDGRLQGVISRRHFLEVISQPYGRELFLQRSVATLHRFITHNYLRLSGTTKITEAAQHAIARPSDLLYEPIVVESQRSPTQPFYLLDVHDLLQAQSTVHQLTTNLLAEKTRAERMQSEKMAALGKMMAGVAHEIRNPVNFIWGNLNYFEEYTEDLITLIQAYEEESISQSDSLRKIKKSIDLDYILRDLPQLLQSMKTGTDRLRNLVTSLRTFARMDELQRDLIDIHQSLDSTLQILNNRLKEGVTVHKQYADSLPEVSCFSGQMGQVFMNIISNAIDALLAHQAALSQSADGSTNRESASPLSRVADTWQPCITLTTHQCDRLPAEITRNMQEPPLTDTAWISIRIRDNGPGIPAAIQSKVFDDFFTTKPAGDGTGLGLPITRQIVTEKHGGHLILRSPIPSSDHTASPSMPGTEFEIFLPTQVDPPSKATARSPDLAHWA